MPRATPPKLDGLRPRERAEVIVRYQIENEMPIGLRQIAIYQDGATYTEDQIRRFGKLLAYMRCKDTPTERVYRIELAHIKWDNYKIVSSSVPDHEEQLTPATPDELFRKLWEDHSTVDSAWVLFRKEFGEGATMAAIDRAMEVQEMREAGEIE
jgi:hypothetical protein